MQLDGQQEFDVSSAVIWDTVFRPEVLEACIPGAKRVSEISEDAYEAEIERSLASITVAMELRVDIVEDNRPSGIRCELEGADNRVNSTVHGDGSIEIEPQGETGSLLTYEAELSFTGRLVSLGSRMIKRQMNKDLQTFFASLEEYIENHPPESKKTSS